VVLVPRLMLGSQNIFVLVPRRLQRLAELPVFCQHSDDGSGSGSLTLTKHEYPISMIMTDENRRGIASGVPYPGANMSAEPGHPGLRDEGTSSTCPYCQNHCGQLLICRGTGSRSFRAPNSRAGAWEPEQARPGLANPGWGI